ncbi:MAG: recombinase family protein [Firmicutes bacterium]|nr:recombinase family protein [Bacillota bacterium]
MSDKIIREMHDFEPLKRKKVAIYCRVSTSHPEQMNSLKNQVDRYTQWVKRRLDWDLVDIYKDIRSGKNNNRPEFNRMIEDALEGKIDLIITKSVSRFGRNAEETLGVLNKLRVKRVEVFFDNEDLRVSDPRNTLIISIIEAFSQAESDSRSQNIKMGIHQKLRDGTSKLYDRPCYGYRKGKDGRLEVNLEQALVVQKIYSLYLEGASIIGIIRVLEKEDIKSPSGRDKWSKRTIDNILSNEKYIGNVLIGKTYSDDFPNNKRLKNNGERTQYLGENSHPEIIYESDFEKVQAEKQRRSNIERTPEGVRRKSKRYNSDRPNIMEGDDE